MDESLVALDMEHYVSASGAPSMSIKKSLVRVSPTLGFFSMRHSEIFEEEVDFQEHCVKNLWVV
jgi:hypothetical protein